MAYTPEWETLADALRRVVAAGNVEADAKRDLCNAIADGAIIVRLVLAEDPRKNLPQSIASADAFNLPARIVPTDIDWRLSRPIKPWAPATQVLGESMILYLARVGNVLERTIETIEVRWSEVSKIFGPATSVVPRPARDPPRRQPGLGAKTNGITEAIIHLWPQKIPRGLSAKDRDNQVLKYLTENNLSVPANLRKAIQRAVKKLDWRQ